MTDRLYHPVCIGSGLPALQTTLKLIRSHFAEDIVTAFTHKRSWPVEVVDNPAGLDYMPDGRWVVGFGCHFLLPRDIADWQETFTRHGLSIEIVALTEFHRRLSKDI